MSRLRVAVVGVGYLGRFHAAKYAGLEGVELVGVADSDLGRAEQVAAEVGCRAYGDYRRLLGQVDAVSIVVPTPAHFEVGREFLSHGADVLIEKPITVTLAEADALIDLAEARGRLIQVGHLERFNPALAAARDQIGDPRFIEARRLNSYTPRGTDVPVVLDLMIHDIEIILHLVPAPVRDIRATGLAVVSPQADVASARLEFANGCVAHLSASRLAAHSERRMHLYQADGCLEVDFGQRRLAVVRIDPAVPPPGLRSDARQMEAGDALADEIRAFVEAVCRRRAPEVTGRMGRAALDVALRILAQIEASGGAPAAKRGAS
ncbi:MAG: Gfo/Idh/MocA family oxidoreductase [Deltaproteobacteria bacterium]|nr:Gfo/Idh/MocA family oxidoreductase [Deltaproteobacteria bacterium]